MELLGEMLWTISQGIASNNDTNIKGEKIKETFSFTAHYHFTHRDKIDINEL